MPRSVCAIQFPFSATTTQPPTAPAFATMSTSAILRMRMFWHCGICSPKDQKATLRGLGFGRLGQSVTREDSPALRGMLRKVRHLVEVSKG